MKSTIDYPERQLKLYWCGAGSNSLHHNNGASAVILGSYCALMERPLLFVNTDGTKGTQQGPPLYSTIDYPERQLKLFWCGAGSNSLYHNPRIADICLAARAS